MSSLYREAARLRVWLAGLCHRADDRGSADHLASALWQDRYAANVDPVRMDRPGPHPGIA